MRKLWILLLIGFSYADGMKALDIFLQNKNSTISANFTQTVYGRKKNKVSTGSMEISRPNKFKWQYNEEDQLIVSDGKVIYIYDKPLAQVTLKKLDASLGKTPALLLAGGSDIKKYYNISESKSNDGLEWVILVPKNSDENNGFKSVLMGFNKTNQNLTQMQFVDSFDNKSLISFTNVQLGVKFPDNEFKFVAPKGTDIVNSDQ